MVSAFRGRCAWLPPTVAALLAMGCTAQGGLEASTEDGARQDAGLVGGTPDDAHPAVFALVAFDDTSIGVCTATLIAPNLLLTARHCVAAAHIEQVVCGRTGLGESRPAESFGATNATSLRDGQPWFGVSEVHVPSESDDTCGFDIALVVLDENVSWAVAAPSVPRIDRDVVTGERYVAVGYGTDESGDSGTRLVASERAVACVPGTCVGGLPDSEFIGEDGICQGDSGGPAFDTAGRVVGVVSRGTEDCGSPVYGMVSAWGELILEVAAHAAELGGYSAPYWVESGTSDPPESGLGDPGAGCGEGLACAAGLSCHYEDGAVERSAEGGRREHEDGVCSALCTSGLECPELECLPLATGARACIARPEPDVPVEDPAEEAPDEPASVEPEGRALGSTCAFVRPDRSGSAPLLGSALLLLGALRAHRRRARRDRA